MLARVAPGIGMGVQVSRQTGRKALYYNKVMACITRSSDAADNDEANPEERRQRHRRAFCGGLDFGGIGWELNRTVP
jgi:hypothetical protein